MSESNAEIAEIAEFSIGTGKDSAISAISAFSNVVSAPSPPAHRQGASGDAAPCNVDSRWRASIMSASAVRPCEVE